MLPYYFLVASIPLVCLLSRAMRECDRRRVLKRRFIALGTLRTGGAPAAVFFLGLFCLLSLRDLSVGVDTARYAWHFEQVAGLPREELFDYRDAEWGYFGLGWLVAVCGGDFRTFLVVIAALCTLPTGYLYATRSPSPLLSLSLYMILPTFMISFSGLRQAVAVALGVPVFCAVSKRRWLRAILWVGVATLFHRSAAVLLLMLPVFGRRFRAVHLPLFALLCGGIYAAKGPLFRFLVSLFGASAADRYGQTVETGGTTMILLLGGFLFLAFFVPREAEIDRETRGLRNLLAISLLIQLFSPVSTLSMRLNYYFLLFVPLCLSRVLTVRRGRLEIFLCGVVRAALAVFFIFYFFARTAVTDSLGIYPYVPLWT